MTNLGLKLQTKLTQNLILTPQLQLSIKILHLNHLELSESIDQEVQENPMLESGSMIDMEPAEAAAGAGDREFAQFIENYARIREEFRMKDRFVGGGTDDDEDGETWELFATQAPDLTNHLLWQLHLGSFSPAEVTIGEEIVGNLDSDGYLRVGLDEIAAAVHATEPEVESVLKRIQAFDPVGIGSRNLTECLLNQIELYGGDDAALLRTIVTDHLDDLSRRNFKKIAKDTGSTEDEVSHAFDVINTLNPKPARGYELAGSGSQQVQPDVYVVKDGDEFQVVLNFEGIPALKINRYYEKLLKDKSVDAKTRAFVQDKLRNAYAFIKGVHQRGTTILRVAKAIVERQREFFEKGIGSMKPLTLRDLAAMLDLHESTISRVTSNKYMLTPTGLYEMKYFFSGGIRKVGSEDVASVTVRQYVKEMIEAEDSKKPMSDQDISDRLKARGYNIARRTVTKYRESLNILPSHMRKK